MFTIDEWKPLIENLGRLTSEGSAPWKASEKVNGKLYCEFGDVRYELGSVDGDNRPPFYLAVSEEGREIDRIAMGSLKTFDPRTATLMTHLTTSIAGMNAISSSIYGLYNQAQRKAYGIAEKATSLRTQLESLRQRPEESSDSED